MSCPHCRSSATTRRKHRSALGYARFNCRACKRRFNQRTGTPFNQLQYPTDIVLLAVLWRLRYKLSFRDVAELLLQRGFEVTHETIRASEFRFAPLLADQLRNRRRGRAGVSWYLDETYVKVAGRWCYLYRAIDRDGDLLDSMLSEHRDKHAARRFLRRLIEVAGPQAAAGHHRSSPGLPQGDSLDPRSESSPPTQPVSEQPHRTGPSRHQAALLPNAGLRAFRVSSTILRGV